MKIGQEVYTVNAKTNQVDTWTFNGSIRTVQRCAAVVAVRAEEGKAEEQRPSLALRRMGKEDTLWHLAKTHRTTVEAIEKANESSWEEGEFLLIPKARV